MRVTWIALSSSYSHTCSSLPAIHAACRDLGDVQWAAVTCHPGDPAAAIVAQIVQTRPDIVAGTAYLFTREPLLRLVRRVKALLPKVTVVLGGPEFLGDNEPFLRAEPAVAAVLRGEGETAFRHYLLARLHQAGCDGINGWCWLDRDGRCHDHGMAVAGGLFETLPPPADSPFFNFAKPFVQLETARGCFARCAYCASSVPAPLRTAPLDWVERELARMQENGVREVRLLDRTFNADPRRCRTLLELFRNRFGNLRFHLEVHPAMLGKPVRLALAQAPPGQLHIEAGLQTSSAAALDALDRPGDPDAAWDGLAFLCGLRNLAVHADLLAGLPGVPLEHLSGDLTRLFALGPAEIQLETLKRLPGTPLCGRADRLGLVFAPDPPYEVLRSDAMSAADLDRARLLSRLVDAYYNDPRLQPVLRRTVAAAPAFMSWLLDALVADGAAGQPASLENRFRALAACAQAHALPEVTDSIRYQWFRHGLPAGRPEEGSRPWKGALPDGLLCIEGNEETARSLRRPRVWMVSIAGRPHWFVYGPPDSAGHQACAVFANSAVPAPAADIAR